MPNILNQRYILKTNAKVIPILIFFIKPEDKIKVYTIKCIQSIDAAYDRRLST